jgi:hypothetical protein
VRERKKEKKESFLILIDGKKGKRARKNSFLLLSAYTHTHTHSRREQEAGRQAVGVKENERNEIKTFFPFIPFAVTRCYQQIFAKQQKNSQRTERENFSEIKMRAFQLFLNTRWEWKSLRLVCLLFNLPTKHAHTHACSRTNEQVNEKKWMNKISLNGA